MFFEDMTLVVENPSAKAGDVGEQVRSLGQEDPLEKGMATHSGVLAWRIPMDREAWWAIVHRVTKSQTQLKRLSTGMHKALHTKKINQRISFISQKVQEDLRSILRDH